MVRAPLSFALLLFATALFAGCRQHRIFLQLQDRGDTIDQYAKDPVDNEDDFGLLTQYTEEYYDADFNSIHRYRTATDRRRQQLITDSCTRFFGKDTVYSSLPDYLHVHAFPDLSSLH